MFNIIKIFFYLFGSLALSLIIYFIVKTQNILSIFCQKFCSDQPYSSKILSKYLLIILSILESPLIFSSLGIISVVISLLKIDNFYINLLAIFYFFLISFIAINVILYCKNPVINFLNNFSAHPQNEKLFSSKTIVVLSLFQTPLLFTLVIIWLHLSSLINSIENNSFSILKIVFSISLSLMFVISALGILKGMNFFITSFSNIGIYFSSIIRKISESNFYTTIGLIEASIIFPFIINLIFLSFLKESKIIDYNFLIFPFLFLIFGFIVYYVSLKSGKISANNFLILKKNNEIEKEIISLNFISQILLDARIIYFFIIIFLFLIKFKIF